MPQHDLVFCVGLLEVVRNNAWVGLADPCKALVQHKTQLYLLDLAALSSELLFQQVTLP